MVFGEAQVETGVLEIQTDQRSIVPGCGKRKESDKELIYLIIRILKYLKTTEYLL